MRISLHRQGGEGVVGRKRGKCEMRNWFPYEEVVDCFPLCIFKLEKASQCLSNKNYFKEQEKQLRILVQFIANAALGKEIVFLFQFEVICPLNPSSSAFCLTPTQTHKGKSI